MALRRFQTSVLLPVSADEAFAWHERPGAFERLAPPWQPVHAEERSGGIRDGDRVTLRVGYGPLSFRWRLEHRGYQPGREFMDVQVQGPFASWQHRHRFQPEDGQCLMWDELEYSLPLGRLAHRLAGPRLDASLRQVFRYRQRLTGLDLLLQARFADEPRKRVAVTGSSGFIGSALYALLTTQGHTVVRLVRRPARGEHEVEWDPLTGVQDPEQLAGVDAVVHLAGENLAGRWTAEKKRRIRQSREVGTRALARSLASMAHPPEVLVSISATGYYGDQGATALHEEHGPGAGFLADVCVGWERGADPAREAGIRVVHPRLGLVLSPDGGLLGAILGPSRAGLGAVIGRGDQVLSWVTRDDVVSALLFAIMEPGCEGPINVTAAAPVTQKAFVRTLSDVLHRPAFLRLPEGMARGALGEAADEMLLASTRALPDKLVAFGYALRDPELEPALRYLLGRMEAPPEEVAPGPMDLQAPLTAEREAQRSR